MCQLADLADSVGYRVKGKESKKLDKHLDIAIEL